MPWPGDVCGRRGGGGVPWPGLHGHGASGLLRGPVERGQRMPAAAGRPPGDRVRRRSAGPGPASAARTAALISRAYRIPPAGRGCTPSSQSRLVRPAMAACQLTSRTCGSSPAAASALLTSCLPGPCLVGIDQHQPAARPDLGAQLPDLAAGHGAVGAQAHDDDRPQLAAGRQAPDRGQAAAHLAARSRHRGRCRAVPPAAAGPPPA